MSISFRYEEENSRNVAMLQCCNAAMTRRYMKRERQTRKAYRTLVNSAGLIRTAESFVAWRVFAALFICEFNLDMCFNMCFLSYIFRTNVTLIIRHFEPTKPPKKHLTTWENLKSFVLEPFQ